MVSFRSLICIVVGTSWILGSLPREVLGEFTDTSVITESSRDSSFFQMEKIPLPATNDSALSGTWAIVRGTPDPNAGSVQVLSDGKIPGNEDSPRENFFFAQGTSQGCIAIDLGSLTEIEEVVTYSWHPTSRGPQVFTLYASRGDKPGFVWNRLPTNADIVESGWSRIATVDTRNNQRSGGQHASRITDSSGAIGQYQYLLFEVSPTDSKDPFGQTFYSEIDVVSKSQNRPERIIVPETKTTSFSSADGLFHYTIDSTAAPELTEWSESELKPVILEWYPRIVKLLPSEGFEAPGRILFRYLPSEKMDGIPAYAQGATITMNAGWMARERTREARGAIVHEMVHVVQSYYNRRDRRTRRSQPPGWIVEGIPDYIRWYLYEPQSQGAVLSKPALRKAKHDASYRVTANFIDWVMRNHDPQGDFLRKLNAAAREGSYGSQVWKELTGQSEEQLAEAWKQQPSSP